MTKNQENQIIIYKSADGKSQVSLYAQDGNIWLSQKQIAELFDTSLPNINMRISAILKEKELQENSVIKYFLITAKDGKNYNLALKQVCTKFAQACDEKELWENSVVKSYFTTALGVKNYNAAL